MLPGAAASIVPLSIFFREKHHRHPSLFGEILDWMLAPLLILWPISMALEYGLATSIANTAYDRGLNDSVVVLSRQISADGGQARVNLPAAAGAILVADEVAHKSYQVRGTGNEVLDGERELPSVEFTPEIEPQRVYFRDDVLLNREVRIAYMFAQIPGLTGAVLVQVAETEEKRIMLSSQIISGVLTAQFILVPLALLLVWFGLGKGIEPLTDLRRSILGRKSQDLSPIPEAEAPEEVRPLIRAINEVMERLHSSFKVQERFVSDAAHQMRTPVAGLKTQAELALRQNDQAGLQHALRQIAVAADRASRLISQLLALARADSDAPAMTPLDLDRMLRETMHEWVDKAMEKRIDLGFEASSHPAWVEGNAILLHELASNLIDNAIRYSAGGGRVTARIRVAACVIIEIEDDGVGIATGERELVFERFYRVLGTQTEGSGLGLAIVRGIAQAHRASVQLLANPQGRGTLVRVTFPPGRTDPRPVPAQSVPADR